VIATLVALGGIAGDRFVLRASSAVDATDYHAAVYRAAENFPVQIGNWFGTNVDLPTGAIQLLRPNAKISREYQNLATGRTVSVVIVQVSDSRDLIGHYPPICYVTHGWTAGASHRRDWFVAGLTIRGTTYAFHSARPDRVSSIVIDNFMILPDGTTCPDLDGVLAVSRDLRKRHFGAAQVQIVTDRDMPPAERAKFMEDFLTAAVPLITQIRTGL
jgi:hypothetical protein